MSLEQQQTDEMANAIAQVINIEQVKSQRAVLNLISTGVEANKNPSDILVDVIEWCSK